MDVGVRVAVGVGVGVAVVVVLKCGGMEVAFGVCDCFARLKAARSRNFFV